MKAYLIQKTIREFFVNLITFSFFFTLLFDSGSAHSQNLEQFYNSSKQPDELNLDTKNNLERVYLEYLSNKNVTDDDGTYKEFVYRYNFSLDRLNKSGKVFFENEITECLNLLKDRILGESQQKNKIKVYVTNSSELNAFTNDFGNIYVNIGTLAKLDSEGELMVILAHEISHVLLEHSFKIENLDNRFEKDKKNKKLTEVDVFSYHSFSRSSELEADSLAIILLQNIGLPHEFFESTLNKLKHSENIEFAHDLDYNNFFFNNKQAIAYVQAIVESRNAKTISYKLNSDTLAKLKDERLQTHPNLDERLTAYKALIDSVNFQKESAIDNTKFLTIKRLASFVFLKSLLDEGDYVTGLFVVGAMRKEAPLDPYLVKSQLKLMLLLTQQKYNFDLASLLINPEGDDCSQIELLRFRDVMLRIPSLEMNILTLQTLKEVNEIGVLANDNYLSRMELFANLFLYKNNSILFKEKNDQIEFNTEISNSSDTIYITKFMSKEQVELYTEFNTIGFNFVDYFWLDSTLVKAYTHQYQDYSSLNKHVAFYKNQRNTFENTLTVEQFEIKTNPKIGYRKYRKSDFMFNSPIDDSSRIVLVGSDNFFLDLIGEGKINLYRTVDLHQKIDEIVHEKELFDEFSTISSSRPVKVSVKDNYEHYVLYNYVDQCWQLSNLIYTSIDEEILELKKTKNVDYVAYLLNICGSRKKKKAYCTYYSIYIDLNTSGITYISKIGSKNRMSLAQLRHYINTGYYGNQED